MASSPFLEQTGGVRLEVTAGSPLAEVFLINHAFALVDRSIGDLDSTVEPGVYKVKARLGDAGLERLVLLQDDLKLDLTEDLRIASPAPIAGTMRTREHDMVAAQDAGVDAVTQLGAGSQLFVMTRRWSPDGAASHGTEALAASLHGPDGEALASIDPADGESTAGATYDVDPGPYLVRWRSESGVAAEQSVYAVADWQTQLFLLQEPGESPDLGRSRVSVLMARAGFDPHDPQQRHVEEARTALADERKVASEFLNEALLEQLDNPMLGLFAAHLMLIARDAARDADREAEEQRARRRSGVAGPRAPVQFDQLRFDDLVRSLRALLGSGHPDVLALATQVSGQDLAELEPLIAPPMLWRSWVTLIEASNDEPRLVPAHTWRRAMAALPLRPFLIWSQNAGEAASQLEQVVERALADVEHPPPTPHALAGPPADGAVEEETAEGGHRRLSRRLLVPRAAIDALGSGEQP